MKAIRFSLMSVLLVVLAAGCSPATVLPDQSQVTPSIDPAFLQSTPSTGPITMEMLKNGEYQAQNGMTLVRLMDGKYEAGSGSDYLSVSMQEQSAFGDLNADGVEDAAIILVENYGGTGQFEYLVPVFNSGVSLSPSSGYFLGDRVAVNSMSIADGRITLDMLVHAPNDGQCCPSQSMTQSFRFYWGPGLVMVHATSGTFTDTLREISIEAPTAGSEVTNQIQLKGRVTIAPFENTLLVRIMDVNNTSIYTGPIMVSAPDMGAPGTFDGLVDLSGSPASPGSIRIEVLEMSMADGSILTMDSVDVTLK
ncbi:MAG: hypothetical protein A2X25_08755 [Chloroflexi bacterium GWB2_49_20]|nr:MAG: hypothetical protein A2X25_08755 [Chloroflexi bacterium GWB2_49_20]OGN79477.1 MAG: hypothetical protein A2X26_05270 [Chloroflexi bacterium GWC2_49_37]OGN84600.1 MAG: hypothetical protein A2X27_11260 [Chloroflexi bacterium GWD2_49_16]HCC79290.1 hypothetical protein [Anaerolineae bacterium]HCM97224.1 hypothetical protein [Anaerolineae bacterium]